MSDLASIAATVKAADYDRYLAALFAPEPRRDHLLTLYAFNHEVAKTAETVREPMLGEIRFAWWSETVEAIETGSRHSRGPVKDLALITNEYSLPKKLLLSLIEARRERDLAGKPIETWAQFDSYADRTAGAVFRMAARIMGCGEAADGASVPAGLAWAMTGHLRSLSANLQRHRLFVPAELFTRHGLNSDDIFHDQDVAKLGPAIDEAIARARASLLEFRRLWRGAPKTAFPAFAYLGLINLYLARLETRSKFKEPSQLQRVSRLLAASITRRI